MVSLTMVLATMVSTVTMPAVTMATGTIQAPAVSNSAQIPCWASRV
jgi:hypothetical protein